MGIQGTLKRLARELNPAVDGIPVERDEIDTAVAGTHNPRHPRANMEMITDNLPVPAVVVGRTLLYRPSTP